MAYAASLAVLGVAEHASTAFFEHTRSSQPASNLYGVDPKLLETVRAVFHEKNTSGTPSRVQYSPSVDSTPAEVELSWTSDTVVATVGGVLASKWSMGFEGQDIQWACWGWLEQPGGVIEQVSSMGRDAAILDNARASLGGFGKETFGPFAQTMHGTDRQLEPSTRVHGVFIFLRSIAKIFLDNGMDYTVHIPFLVRKAWPLHPYGVLVQRVLSKEEEVEASAAAEDVLPTLFSLLDPFGEFRVICCTSKIAGGFTPGNPTSVASSEVSSSTISPSDTVLWASDGKDAHEQIFVTVDARGEKLLLWRYAHVVPEMPVPPPDFKRGSSQDLPPQQGHGHGRSLSTVLADLPIAGEMRPFARDGDSQATASLLPSLTSSGTLSSLNSDRTQRWTSTHERNDSGTRNELSATLDRMALGTQASNDTAETSNGHARIKPAYWTEKLLTIGIPTADSKHSHRISATIFDSRFDGKEYRTLLAICFPKAGLVLVYSLAQFENQLRSTFVNSFPAVAIASVRATRSSIYDLLCVKPDDSLCLLIGGLNELTIHVDIPEREEQSGVEAMADENVDRISVGSIVDKQRIVGLRDAVLSSVTIITEGQECWRVSVDLAPKDRLTLQCFKCLACVLPDPDYYSIFKLFLKHRNTSTSSPLHQLQSGAQGEFAAFSLALISFCEFPEEALEVPANPWTRFLSSSTMENLSRDPAFALLGISRPSHKHENVQSSQNSGSTLRLSGQRSPVVYKLLISSLHLLCEDLKLSIAYRSDIHLLSPLLVKLFTVFRPEWVDYYARLYPESAPIWNPLSLPERIVQDMPTTGASIYSFLYSRLTSSEGAWFAIYPGMLDNAALHFGWEDPWERTRRVGAIYTCFTDSERKEARSRSEKVVEVMVSMDFRTEQLDDVPFGIALPIRESLRLCQMSPPSEWPTAAYELLGRRDLAKMAISTLLNSSEKPPSVPKESREIRQTISALARPPQSPDNANLKKNVSTLDLGDLTGIRFSTDRRLDEVFRMLQPPSVPTVKLDDRVMNDHDITKEQQSTAIRVSERTMALAMGRALLTFATVQVVTNETYKVPKLDFSVRVLPFNVVVTPDPGKIPLESIHWAEFHNGVAAGLRIAPSTHAVASSWITFNKPSELTPEHAGFLYALGLTGHLRSMLTWHTFTYLTPKHDLTSIGVLLGLCAANIGTSNCHITKLLAVHTPALLPKSSIDLNIPLLTQAAGLSGIGLLYLGTGSRRMAEVALSELNRKDYPNPGYESREAYCVSAALAFGMIMIGRGATATSPADLNFISRLRSFIHETKQSDDVRPTYNVNVSPAATIALSMMFLRTNRQDISETLIIPDTVTELNRLPPNFLMYRALGRALIMWDKIEPSHDWVIAQLPAHIAYAMEQRVKGVWVDSALELAYYYVVAGASLVMGLRYAGTAKEEAYVTLIHFYDLFSRIAAIGGGGYDHRIKKAAVREGLNLLSLSLAMVMAGTGEINCLRRFRYAYGQIGPGSKYGSHIANEMAIGMLFLGGGHFTIGSSDAAVACLLATCYPRFPSVSSDNRSHLQALRHLWVVAVEPRCLIARDVDSGDVVYLPVKVQVKEGETTRSTQLISPTLIPDLGRLMAIKVDTPRYWPFILDITKVPRHRDRLLQNQTLWIKRRTGFLGYSEDPKGSRSIFVRAGAASGDAAMLEFPADYKDLAGPTKDFKDFISSFSIHPAHLAFADRLCRMDDQDGETRVFETFAHAALLECLTLDKAEMLPAHLEIHNLRSSHPDVNGSFAQHLENLMFAASFYTSVYDKKFSLKNESQDKLPLLRPGFLLAALSSIDKTLASYRSEPAFLKILRDYCSGRELSMSLRDRRRLAAYLVRESVPQPNILVQLRNLAQQAHTEVEAESGGLDSSRMRMVDGAIRSVLHETAVKASRPSINKWSMRSLDEIIGLWGAS